MKNKMIGVVSVILVSVFVLSGCGASLQGLGSMLNIDLENKKINCKFDAGLLGLETVSGDTSGTGDVKLDVQLDLKNKSIRCKVNTDSSDSGNGEMDFFLNWNNINSFCVLDTEYPSTEEEKAAGAPDINSFHFDLLLDLQKKKIGTNLNVGPYDLHVPLSEGSNNEGENKK